MINSVSGVSFKANNVDLAAPSKFSNAQAAAAIEQPADSFEMEGSKKSNKGTAIALGTLGTALAAVGGLGWAVRAGRLNKAAELAEDAGFFKKAFAKVQDWAHAVGDWTNSKVFNTVAGWFGKGEKAAEAAADAAAETVA